MLSVVAALCVLEFVSASKKYIATFGDNGFTGKVTVDNGQVSVDLDLSSQPDFGISQDFAACTAGGLQWHIHRWLYNETDTSDKLGTACGPSHTGGHVDPWHGM